MRNVSPPRPIRGITWDHSRGFVPLVATAQAFHDFRPDFEIQWDKRSLWAFGEGTLDDLAATYDLLVVDYPMAGLAASLGLLVPLDDVVPDTWLAARAADSAGPSHRSYVNGGHQWAAAIDAACQVAASRPDELDKLGLSVPRTWPEVLRLARETGRVTVPLWSADTLSTFSTLCANQGQPPYRADGIFVDIEMGRHALEQMRELFALIPPECIDMNPIQILNSMAQEADGPIYCPFTLGYTNYSREGFARNRLEFHDLPAAGDEGSRGAILGGTGLAISARSDRREEVVEYLSWVASTDCQRSTYFMNGGQPASRTVWEDDFANEITSDFFRNTRATLNGAQVRPSHPGMIPFQTRSGAVLKDHLLGRLDEMDALRAVNRLYRESLDV